MGSNIFLKKNRKRKRILSHLLVRTKWGFFRWFLAENYMSYLVTMFDTMHIVWKSPKMSHLNVSILTFSTNLCQSESTVWPQKLPFWHFYKLLSTKRWNLRWIRFLGMLCHHVLEELLIQQASWRWVTLDFLSSNHLYVTSREGFLQTKKELHIYFWRCLIDFGHECNHYYQWCVL